MKDKKSDYLCRREFLTAATLAGLAFGTSNIVSAKDVKPAPQKAGAKRVLRFAHLTDIHLQPEKGAPEGFTACLRHAQGLDDPPQMIIAGGDMIMDSFEADETRTALQWKLFHKIIKDQCSLPVKSCIGNHDIWGWNKQKSRTTGNEYLWGKKRAVHELNIPNRFYSFDHAGWHFIILDSTQTDGKDGYIAKLDDEQYEWLRKDMKRVSSKTPVLVVSHEPILSAATFFASKVDDNGWAIPMGWMHLDTRKIKDLFKEHTNVKLCISGHLHLNDHVKYVDVDYICDGAVSGSWWDGNNQECDEGYGIFDLYDDGTFAHQYVSYDWKPVP